MSGWKQMLRRLVREPGFSTVTVLTLALALAARQEHDARLRQAARESCEHARQLRLKSEQLYASVAKWLEEARELRRGPGSR